MKETTVSTSGSIIFPANHFYPIVHTVGVRHYTFTCKCGPIRWSGCSTSSSSVPPHSSSFWEQVGNCYVL